MTRKKSNARIVYYIVAALSIVLFAIGLTMSDSLSKDITKFIGLEVKYFYFADYVGLFAFCLWAWLIVVGILFIPKNWIVISIIIALAIPHMIVIAVSIGYSYGLVRILKMYVAIFSFGFLIL